MGGASQQVFATAMATDPNGFLYVAGSFTGSGDVGQSHGGEDAFTRTANEVAKDVRKHYVERGWLMK